MLPHPRFGILMLPEGTVNLALMQCRILIGGVIAVKTASKEALGSLLMHSSWIVDCSLDEVFVLMSFFSTQHACYLEQQAGQLAKQGGEDAAFAYQVLVNTLAGMARFKTEFPDVTAEELLRLIDSGMEL